MKNTIHENFEKVYLRYKDIDVDSQLISDFIYKYQNTIDKAINFIYSKFYFNFDKVGFDFEDLQSICYVYISHFIKKKSLIHNKEKGLAFFNNYFNKHQKHITSQQIERYEEMILFKFLKDQLHHCSTFCERKSANIQVGRNKKIVVAFTKNSISADEELIFNNYKKYGYRKVTNRELKEIKRIPNHELVDKEGFKILEIQKLHLQNYEFEEQVIQECLYDNNFYGGPEEKIIDQENYKEFEVFKNHFKKLSISRKRGVLTRFIRKNKNNKALKKEITIARKMIKNLKNGV